VGLDKIVIVGASLAGLRAAEELRVQGHDRSITIVGDEPHRPYDRPPLSKQVLAGTKPPESTALAVARGTLDDLDLDWRLGESATGLDLRHRSVLLAGGEQLPYDGLVIATGASPIRSESEERAIRTAE
jgi:NADPH-dependent 2,4-dienoyl-CoA reductase/sulfur reductase-like enzyme